MIAGVLPVKCKRTKAKVENSNGEIQTQLGDVFIYGLHAWPRNFYSTTFTWNNGKGERDKSCVIKTYGAAPFTEVNKDLEEICSRLETGKIVIRRDKNQVYKPEPEYSKMQKN